MKSKKGMKIVRWTSTELPQVIDAMAYAVRAQDLPEGQPVNWLNVAREAQGILPKNRQRKLSTITMIQRLIPMALQRVVELEAAEPKSISQVEHSDPPTSGTDDGPTEDDGNWEDFETMEPTPGPVPLQVHQSMFTAEMHESLSASLARAITESVMSSIGLIMQSAAAQAQAQIQEELAKLRSELAGQSQQGSENEEPDYGKFGTAPKVARQRVIILGPWASLYAEIDERAYPMLELIQARELSEVRRAMNSETYLVQVVKLSAHLPKDIKKKVARIFLINSGITGLRQKLTELNDAAAEQEESPLLYKKMYSN